ncbi:MAG: type IV pilus twitching motility protein PilT [Vulcanimicrobiota bacterium]
MSSLTTASKEALLPILKNAVEARASDIHLVIGRHPMVRLTGTLVPLKEFPILEPDMTQGMIYGVLTSEQIGAFERDLELDCSFQIPDISRFRTNVHRHKDGVGAALRVISSLIPTPEEIGLPESIREFTRLQSGIVLVTGTTGSGKSTTLACLIDIINRERSDHIITIEDPIEFVYEQKQCVITQREVGNQTHSFANALKSALRQDPDIILVGEMRDLETISLALTAAETGHLVFGTLHTSDAPKTIDRIVDVFPPYQQQQIKVQLSTCLKAVIAQTLIAKADHSGRVAAREILVATPAVTNLIREGKTHQIYGAIETGMKQGMMSMDRSLANLVKEGVITQEEAIAKAHDARTLQSYLGISTGGW